MKQRNKPYELSNHLSNVIATVSDRKIGVENTGDNVVDYFSSEILSASDYFCFGKKMSGRNFNSTAYPMSFNGKRDDAELGLIDFDARMYNEDLGRFQTTDARTSLYPSYSPYLFAGNNPILFIDVNGEGDGEKSIPKGNILLVIPTQTEIKSGMYKYVSGNQGNWYVIIANDMVDAYAKAKDYLGTQKVNNIVISTHGSTENGTLMLSNTPANTEITGDSPAVVTHKTFDNYDKLPATNKNKKEITAIIKLSGLVSNKGKFILNSCKSACGTEGVKLANSIKSLVGDKVTLIMSEAYVTESGANFKPFKDIKNQPNLSLSYPTDIKMDVPYIDYTFSRNKKGQQYIKVGSNTSNQYLGNLILHQDGSNSVEFKSVDNKSKSINNKND